tara:strand:+ start:1735 stop:1872 length:138 start_codon:yes stop_codon:yes gene_type:complete
MWGDSPRSSGATAKVEQIGEEVAPRSQLSLAAVLVAAAAAVVAEC